MFVASPHSLALATILGGWELVLILAVFLILLAAKRLPEIMRGLGHGMSEFGRELDRQAHEAGKSAGGISGKPAAEALTPDNQTAERASAGNSRCASRFQRSGRFVALGLRHGAVSSGCA